MEDHYDEIQENEKRGTRKSVHNEPSNIKPKDVAVRAEPVSETSKILLDNKSSDNAGRESSSSEIHFFVLHWHCSFHLKLLIIATL